jgi:hypothetical protein
MDVLFKGAALLYTQVTCTLRVLFVLPWHIVANLIPRSHGPEPGCTYYEGQVHHTRRRPVYNTFQ